MEYTAMFQTDWFDIVSLIHLFAWVSTAAIVLARLVPATRQRFLTYGARGQSVASADQHRSQSGKKPTIRLLDWLGSLDVPHSWFTHFYVLSLCTSAFWLTQVVTRGKLLCSLRGFVSHSRPVTAAQNGLLCTMLMFLQSIRRLWESYQFSRKSKSRMWIGHYVFGLAFYWFINIAVWIESIHSITESRTVKSIVRHQPLHVVFGLAVFFIASILQHMAHAHLASLPKYSIPRHWLFQKVIAPHYTAECLIYLTLATMSAPQRYLLNRSVLSIALLTIVNLSITAHGTRLWMMDKFRENESELRQKYCIFPGLW